MQIGLLATVFKLRFNWEKEGQPGLMPGHYRRATVSENGQLKR